VLVLWLLRKPAASTAASAPPPTLPAVAAPAVAPSPTPAAPAAVAPGTVISAATQASVDAALADDASDADRAAAIADEQPASASHLRHYSDLVGELPALHLDFHVYSPAVAARYAFINMHKVREGETTAEGMRVLAITRDGVELRYMNREFLLSRE
jgi:hypothetical protein